MNQAYWKDLTCQPSGDCPGGVGLIPAGGIRSRAVAEHSDKGGAEPRAGTSVALQCPGSTVKAGLGLQLCLSRQHIFFYFSTLLGDTGGDRF